MFFQKNIEPGSRDQGGNRIFLILSFYFILTRVISYLVGVRFDVSGLERFWQAADVSLLRERLLETVYNLHCQPPLYNFFIGLILKIFGDNASTAFQGAHLIMGLLLTIILAAILRKFRIPDRLVLVVTGVFIISPSVILYENWLFYTYPISLVLLAGMFFLMRFVESRKFTDALIFFGLLAIAALSRSIFHLIWFLLITAGMIFTLPELKRKIVFAALVPVIIILGLYSKNDAEFGIFGGSSWFGFNFSSMTTAQLPGSLRDRLIEENKLSPLARLTRFSPPEDYNEWFITEYTGVPVLDEKYKSNGAPNYNHLGYINISRIYKKDAVYVLTNYPGY